MYVFIGGTPTAGKTYTAKEFIKKSSKKIFLLSTDDLRKSFLKNPKLKTWVQYFQNQDEVKYWKITDYKKGVQELIDQSEAFWPDILETIHKTKKEHKHAIFEGVNILPHLANKGLSFPGFFLINEDYNSVLKRNMMSPRWGKTKELQELEAKYFIEHDVKFIKKEAKKYNYKVLNNEKDAVLELKALFC